MNRGAIIGILLAVVALAILAFVLLTNKKPKKTEEPTFNINDISDSLRVTTTFDAPAYVGSQEQGGGIEGYTMFSKEYNSGTADPPDPLEEMNKFLSVNVSFTQPGGSEALTSWEIEWKVCENSTCVSPTLVRSVNYTDIGSGKLVSVNIPAYENDSFNTGVSAIDFSSKGFQIVVTAIFSDNTRSTFTQGLGASQTIYKYDPNSPALNITEPPFKMLEQSTRVTDLIQSGAMDEFVPYFYTGGQNPDNPPPFIVDSITPGVFQLVGGQSLNLTKSDFLFKFLYDINNNTFTFNKQLSSIALDKEFTIEELDDNDNITNVFGLGKYTLKDESDKYLSILHKSDTNGTSYEIDFMDDETFQTMSGDYTKFTYASFTPFVKKGIAYTFSDGTYRDLKVKDVVYTNTVYNEDCTLVKGGSGTQTAFINAVGPNNDTFTLGMVVSGDVVQCISDCCFFSYISRKGFVYNYIVKNTSDDETTFVRFRKFETTKKETANVRPERFKHSYIEDSSIIQGEKNSKYGEGFVTVSSDTEVSAYIGPVLDYVSKICELGTTPSCKLNVT